ncbi:MAG: hypothetical protein LBM93_09780 [Oscillospiraceae bacterium]|nr:hypothetical protein [Oscillospiraceae bacterium]
MDWESVIKKIDRHKMLTVIEVEFMGGSREIKIGMEILEKHIIKRRHNE